MKIVYLSNSVVPSKTANSVHVAKMASAFAAVGADVELVVQDNDTSTEYATANIYEFYGVAENFGITKVSWWSRIRGRSYIYSFLSAISALRVKPDIVYCRNLAGAFFAVMFGLNIYFEAHAPVNSGGRMADRMFRFLIGRRGFLKLVVITKSLEQYYLARYPELRGKIHVAPDGADIVELGRAQSEDKIGTDGLDVGYVGHLYKGKGVEVVLELARCMGNHRFHIVGGLEEDIAYWSAKANGLDNLTFHGHVAPSEVSRFLAGFDVVLLPNQRKVSVHGGGDIAEWTSPLKMFEYMAAEKAIIASDLPVLREILVDEHNALLCDPENIRDWVEALEKLSKSQCLKSGIAERAWIDLTEKYSWHVRARNMMRQFSASLGSSE